MGIPEKEKEVVKELLETRLISMVYMTDQIRSHAKSYDGLRQLLGVYVKRTVEVIIHTVETGELDLLHEDINKEVNVAFEDLMNMLNRPKQ
jgi:hypothetical protein